MHGFQIILFSRTSFFAKKANRCVLFFFSSERNSRYDTYHTLNILQMLFLFWGSKSFLEDTFFGQFNSNFCWRDIPNSLEFFLAFGGLDTEKLLGNAEMILWKILENPHIFIIPKGAGLLEVFFCKKKERKRAGNCGCGNNLTNVLVCFSH